MYNIVTKNYTLKLAIRGQIRYSEEDKLGLGRYPSGSGLLQASRALRYSRFCWPA